MSHIQLMQYFFICWADSHTKLKKKNHQKIYIYEHVGLHIKLLALQKINETNCDLKQFMQNKIGTGER